MITAEGLLKEMAINLDGYGILTTLVPSTVICHQKNPNAKPNEL
jgi:hypothetical protein